jgi:hypothetical protein
VGSQEQFFYDSPSTSEGAQEDKFEEGDYRDEEVASLEDMLWPQECMHNVHTYTKIVHKFEREEKEKMEEIHVLEGRSSSHGNHEGL